MEDELAAIRNLLAGDEFSAALKVCDDALLRDPDRVDIVLEKVKILASPVPEFHDPEAAVAILNRVLEKHPKSADLHSALAYVYGSGMGEYGLAAREYRIAIELRPDEGGLYLALALLAGAPGSGVSTQDAIDYLEQGVSKAPSDWQVRRELALLVWEGGHYSRAESQLEAALTCEPPPEEYSRRQIEQWLQSVRSNVKFSEGFLSRHG